MASALTHLPNRRRQVRHLRYLRNERAPFRPSAVKGVVFALPISAVLWFGIVQGLSNLV